MTTIRNSKAAGAALCIAASFAPTVSGAQDAFGPGLDLARDPVTDGWREGAVTVGPRLTVPFGGAGRGTDAPRLGLVASFDAGTFGGGTGRIDVAEVALTRREGPLALAFGAPVAGGGVLYAEGDEEGPNRTALYVLGGVVLVGGAAFLLADALEDTTETVIDCTVGAIAGNQDDSCQE